MATHKIDINHVTKFDGSYYNIWKHRLTLIFKAEKLWPIVSGSETIPMAPSATEVAVGTPALSTTRVGSISAWEDKDALSLTIINNCLKNNIVSHIQSCKSAHLAWQE